MNSYIPVTNSKYIRGDYNSAYHMFSQIQPSMHFVSGLFTSYERFYRHLPNLNHKYQDMFYKNK